MACISTCNYVHGVDNSGDYDFKFYNCTYSSGSNRINKPRYQTCSCLPYSSYQYFDSGNFYPCNKRIVVYVHGISGSGS